MYQMVCAIGSIDRVPGSIFARYRGACAQQAMIVVDEVGIAVVDPLVIRHVGVGGMDAHALGHDLLERPACANQVVVDLAGADLSRIRTRSSSLA